MINFFCLLLIIYLNKKFKQIDEFEKLVKDLDYFVEKLILEFEKSFITNNKFDFCMFNRSTNY